MTFQNDMMPSFAIYNSTYLEFDPEFQSGSRFNLTFESNNLFSDFLCSNIESTYYMPDTFSMP